MCLETLQLPFFYVLLAVHPNIMRVRFYQFDVQILYFNTFITFLYMFGALLCSLAWVFYVWYML